MGSHNPIALLYYCMYGLSVLEKVRGTYDYFDYAGPGPFVARAAVTINFIPLSPACCKVLTLFYIDYQNSGWVAAAS